MVNVEEYQLDTEHFQTTRSFKVTGNHAVQNDCLLVLAVIRMLDDDPIERWESRNDGKRIPAFKEPKTFLSNQAIALESRNSTVIRIKMRH